MPSSRAASARERGRVDDDPRTIASPADGRVVSIGRVDVSGRLTVKGRPYSVGELVGDDGEAERFLGGAGCVVYLSPRDYHRVHAPVSGTIRRIRSIAGDYFPVNDVGMRHVPQLLCRNRRVAIEIDSTDDCPGRVTVVMVVAMVVGRITTLGIDARDVPFGDHEFQPSAARRPRRRDWHLPPRIDRGRPRGRGGRRRAAHRRRPRSLRAGTAAPRPQPPPQGQRGGLLSRRTPLRRQHQREGGDG